VVNPPRERPSASGSIDRPHTARQEPEQSGTSRQGAPTRTRHLLPSMSCRFVHADGRPDHVGTGNSGSNRAHCSSVRSSRLTARVATRSPVFRFSSWSMNPLPETSTYFTTTTRPSHRTSRQTLGPRCRGVTDEHQSGSRRVLSRQNALPSGSARTCHGSSPVWPMSAGRAPSFRRRSSSAS
jgi:hypothetical protein